MNVLWSAIGCRFLSPLLDVAQGSIPSPACDINRSLQPQGCPLLVITACTLLAGTTPSAGQQHPHLRSLGTTIMQALKSICKLSKARFWPAWNCATAHVVEE